MATYQNLFPIYECRGSLQFWLLGTFILFHRCLLSSYCVLGILLLGARESTVNTTDKALAAIDLFSVGETDKNQINELPILKHVYLSAYDKDNEVE